MISDKNQAKLHSRFFPRQGSKSNLYYLKPGWDKGKAREAQLLNKSYGGICIKIREALEPSSRVQIFFPNIEALEISAQNLQTQYLATVRWCQESRSSELLQYCVGVSFLQNECQFCAQVVPYEQLRLTEPNIILCADCYQELQDLHPGRLKVSLLNLLLGNVL
ncbi:MAG: PilZ domain-containing protein [Desulfohalobiaceae bacterium]